MRLFVALPFSQEVKESLLDAIGELRAQGRGNFTRAENLHLTLAFIGETDRCSAAVGALSKLEADAFSVRLRGAGNFGSLIWAGVAPSAELDALAEQVQQLLRDAGFALEHRAFKPHITLAREYVPYGDSLPRLTPAQTGMCVERVCLMKSERIAGKLTYTEVYERRLNGVKTDVY